MAELNSEIIKKTQDILGKYVKKPVLTEKLLKKPPFRFLHDIITSLMQSSGYFEGLFEPDELVSTNIKDKEAKISFLQKVIDVVKISTKENIKAKPSKIVAGHEPERTNELLQLIGIALDKKISSSEAVKLVKNNKIPENKSNKNASTKPNKLTTQSSVDSIKTKSKSSDDVKTKTFKDNNKIIPKTKESKDKVSDRTSRDLKEKEAKNIRANRDTKKPTKDLKSNDKTNSDKGKLKTGATPLKKISKANPEDSGLNSDTKLNPIPEDVHGSSDNKDPMGEAVVESNKSDLQKSFEPEIVSVQIQTALTKPNSKIIADEISDPVNIEDIKNEPVQQREEDSVQEVRRKSDVKIEKPTFDEKNNEEVDDVNKNESNVAPHVDNEQNEIPQEAGYVDSNKKLKSARKKPIKIENQEIKSNGIIEDNVNNGSAVIPSIPRPRTSLRPPSVRPASARPGAPRRRDRNIEIILQPDENLPKPGVHIKIDHLDMDLDDDGENLVIIEDSASQLNLLDDSKFSTDALNENDGEQQGHLVQQILETQKEFLKIDQNASEAKRKAEIEWDTTNSHQRQSSAKQLDSLRDSIQKLTKSINPLGKLMDFLQEDIDSMQMELSMWKNSYANTKIELKREHGLTESATEPLKLQVANIESDIQDQIEIMDLARSDIMENEEKILKLLKEM